jgi:hypothetical protein
MDTDGDNTGGVNQTREEELAEAQSPGKRLFINHDDDNRDGIPDKDETGNYEYDNDLVEARLDFGLSTYEGLGGYRLALLYASNLRLWKTPERADVASLGGQPDPDGALAQRVRIRLS